MSAPNFRPMEYDMPLIVGGMEDLPEYDLYEEFYDAERLADDMTEDLKYHEITVIGGYYQGFQFYVMEKYADQFDLCYDSPYCIDNDDSHYYFDKCRSAAIRAAEAEKRKIRRWLNGLRDRGYDCLICTGRFCSGEASYAYA